MHILRLHNATGMLSASWWLVCRALWGADRVLGRLEQAEPAVQGSAHADMLGAYSARDEGLCIPVQDHLAHSQYLALWVLHLRPPRTNLTVPLVLSKWTMWPEGALAAL